MQRLKDFFREESGVVSAEYVIMLAVLGIVAAAGIWILYGGPWGICSGPMPAIFRLSPNKPLQE
jgi:hypothetical protein